MRFGPPGAKRLVYFIDDVNMPFVDKYDTQSAIELLRQSLDYRGWFDKVQTPACGQQANVRSLMFLCSAERDIIGEQVKIVLKEVTNIQYSACMNPTAGSFHITPRMQRHFATFAVQMPSLEIARQALQLLWSMYTRLRLTPSHEQSLRCTGQSTRRSWRGT